MNFVHLHVHSHYSLLTGLPKIKELVKAAKERGFEALALTDYGSMYGIIQFYEKCKEEGIKPLLGCEVFIAPRARHDKQPKIDAHASHLVLLAQTLEGYQNLMRISSIGHLEGFYYRPRIDKEVLRQYRSGIIALSGCMGGEIPQCIRNGATDTKVDEVIKEYTEIFGVNNFFLELQDHPEKEGQVEVNSALTKASKRTGTPLVVTRDVHYLNPVEAEAQDVLTCIKDGKTLDAPGRFTLRHVDRSLNDTQDITRRFKHVPEAISNTVAIAQRCTVEIPVDVWYFPDVTIAEGNTAEGALKGMVHTGLQKRFGGNVSHELVNRVQYELDVINKRGFAPYFLAVSDYIAWAKAKGIVTTTRGSAAGSLVSYCIGITNVDPVRFKLPFERFLNPFRPSPPDIDADFADYRRDEVIRYVTEKYGVENVAQICTFGTMAARASIRDVGRVLGYSYGMVDKIAKLVPFGSQGFPMTIKRALEISPEFKEAYTHPEVTRMVDLAQKIEGCARHVSVHAAGVVIAPQPLTNFTPVQREPGGNRIITQYEMRSVEKTGILKMDFLGLRNLSILEEAIRYTRKTKGVEINIDDIPFDDAATYQMLGAGNTTGVFQLSGAAMTKYLKDLKPTVITDIMAMVALYRPGPIEIIPEFIARKHDPSKITYLDERLKEVLDMSYGLLTYQDDVLLTAIHIAGYTWGEADKLRKAMGKKIPEEMAKQKEKFVEGAIANHTKPAIALELWNLIEPFAAYGFNKAHAASYGIIAYHTAYMKAHYPAEYMAAVLSCESGDLETVAENIVECRKMGIPVLPPHINESFELFGVVNNERGEHIRFGLGAIKNVGEHIAEVLIEERKRGGVYTSLEDMLIRVRDRDLNKKSLESLIRSGAMDIFGDRGVLLANIEHIVRFSHEIGGMLTSRQHSLFGGENEGLKIRLEGALPTTEEEKLRWEKELLGLYISAHPMEQLEHEYDNRVSRIAAFFVSASRQREKWACVGGVVQGVKKMVTKRGELMAFMTSEDTTGALECVVFPKVFGHYQELLTQGATVMVVGKKDVREGDPKLLVERVALVSASQVRQTIDFLFSPRDDEIRADSMSVQQSDTINAPAIVITLSGEHVLDLPMLKQELGKRPGPYRVYMNIDTGRAPKTIATGISTSVSETLLAVIRKHTGENSVRVIEMEKVT